MQAYNANFLSELTGRAAADAPLLVTDILPGFYEASAIASFAADHTTYVTSAGTPVSADEAAAVAAVAAAANSDAHADDENEASTSATIGEEHATATPAKRFNSVPSIQCGSFFGLVRHIGGLMVPVRFDITRLDGARRCSTTNATAAIDASTAPQRLYAVALGYERGVDFGFCHVDVIAESAAAAAAAETPTDERAASLAASLDERADEAHDGELEMRAPPSHTNGAITNAATALLNGAASLQRSASDAYAASAAGSGAALVPLDEEVSLSTLADESNEAVRGEYSAQYETYDLLGAGSFGTRELGCRLIFVYRANSLGSVKLAARKDTGLLTVTKFICKNKVLPEAWIHSPQRGNRMTPIEIHLLETLNHPNIVSVLDIFGESSHCLFSSAIRWQFL